MPGEPFSELASSIRRFKVEVRGNMSKANSEETSQAVASENGLTTEIYDHIFPDEISPLLRFSAPPKIKYHSQIHFALGEFGNMAHILYQRPLNMKIA
ncbi:hypothetical protein WA026_022121 [Henosepilachna vigintioctopunctata]|uniref:Uncharacterized protein n=1 Tax=Henosepilachna vigintioctopunctata TaxID=420089 RepID=A0AAW1U662_9CUCU